MQAAYYRMCLMPFAFSHTFRIPNPGWPVQIIYMKTPQRWWALRLERPLLESKGAYGPSPGR
jgi:hypothetical protein